jgi:hypothetical protein
VTSATSRPRPGHTPYDGSGRPFTIGLKPFDLSDWIEMDDDLEAYLSEKERLLAEAPGAVSGAEPGTEAAQQEVLDLLLAHLTARFPEIYRRDGGTMTIAPSGRTVDLGDVAVPPLVTAARLVQEDLVLMRKDESGWRLVAGVVCFPSSWSLAEKFGRPLQVIHNPVPGFGEGTRTATVIARIFDNLKVDQPVVRMNWSLHNDALLHHPSPSGERGSRFPAGAFRTNAFIRVERQTLRRLPVSDDVLFTIRIHVDPMDALARHPDGARLAAGFAAQLGALDAGQLAYKGLDRDRDVLVAELTALAADGNAPAPAESAD